MVSEPPIRNELPQEEAQQTGPCHRRQLRWQMVDQI